MTTWINPTIIEFGGLSIRWYSVMYVVGYVVGSFLLKKLAREKFWPLDESKIDSFVTYLIIGMFFGARIFYVFVYNWDYYSQNLHEFFYVWKGGLSFHGAVIGMTFSCWLFAKKNKVPFYKITDSMAVAGSQGLFWGRMGNFINGELYGRVTDSWVGMVFPGGGPFPRHPSQLYEGFMEGILLFAILFWLRKRTKYYGTISGFFVLFYGIFRFIVEFFREPDAQLGYYFGFLTMGQILCFLMILFSSVFFITAYKLKIKNPLSKK